MDKERRPEQPDNTIFGAMRVNPRQYKASWNDSFWDRTKYAIAGLLFMLRRERSIRNVTLSGVAVFILAIWLEVGITHGVILVLAFGMLWSVETLNSAVEAVVDMVTQEYHPMAKVAKDVAASATLVASVTSFLISVALVGLPLLERLNIL
jgi:diacylglycerol kinase